MIIREFQEPIEQIYYAKKKKRICIREEPPEVCPICKAKKDRFERFI